MSYFTTELQSAIEYLGCSRALFAERSGIPSSTFHGLVHGGLRPSVEALEKICSILEPEQRAIVVIGHLRDEIPPLAADLIRIVSLVGTPRMQESEPEVRLPKSVRADFRYLELMAMKHPEVVESIRSTVRILRDVSVPPIPNNKDLAAAIQKQQQSGG